jgi:hypothetical protein
MKSLLILAALGAVSATPGLASAADIRFKDVVANVQVIPETRSDFKVDVVRTYPGLPAFQVTRTANGVVVDGGLYRRLNSCGGFGGIHIKDGPRVPKNAIPQIVVHAPLDFRLRANGYVQGQVGSARTVGLEVSGCGDWTVGDVSQKFSLEVSGLGDVHVGHTGASTVSLSGLGDVDIVSVNGPLDIDASGLGGIRVHGGHATVMKASLSGMGDLTFKGTADSLDASASGMGGINVAKVTGAVRKNRSGLASIKVGT